MGYRFGIDAGSKTVKVVILDEDGKIIGSVYRRHLSNIRETLTDILHNLTWRFSDLSGTAAVTGSAGIALADMLGAPFFQEVLATTRAVRKAYPDADAVIELGGEDAKVMYLSGTPEQRMNATCAGAPSKARSSSWADPSNTFLNWYDAFRLTLDLSEGAASSPKTRTPSPRMAPRYTRERPKGHSLPRSRSSRRAYGKRPHRPTTWRDLSLCSEPTRIGLHSSAAMHRSASPKSACSIARDRFTWG